MEYHSIDCRPWSKILLISSPSPKIQSQSGRKRTVERRLQIDQKLSSAPKKWLRARFEMGGAYLNFELEIHIVRLILKKTMRISVKN
jgi:hypothetical protein